MIKKHKKTTESIDNEKVAGYSDDIELDISENSIAEQVKKLRDRLKECEVLKKEYLDGWQRAKADFVNARKADEEQRNRLIKFAKEGLISDLLLAVDSFEMAFSDKKAWESVNKEWRVGIEQIHNQLMETLKAHGLTQFSPIREHFDPSRHDSVESVVVDDEKNDNIILEVVQKGYILNGKVIRPAKVRVGQCK